MVASGDVLDLRISEAASGDVLESVLMSS